MEYLELSKAIELVMYYMTETNRIEYKIGLTPELDIEKEIVAFINY